MNTIIRRAAFSTRRNLLTMGMASQSRWQQQQQTAWAYGLPLLAGTAYMLAKSREEEPALALEYADRIRGNYENKIRFFSPPEKIFEVFATKQEADGGLKMSYKDFMHALTPFNYDEIKSNEWREAYIENHKEQVMKVMRIADPDGDGTVDFTEFLFFITIQQMPTDVLENIFTTGKDGKMSEKEFAKALNLHRKSTKLGQKMQEKKTQLDARNIKVIEADFKVTCKKLTKKLFAGRKEIALKDILNLRDDIQIALWHYEFTKYINTEEEEKAQQIDMADFAKSLLIVMPFNKYNQYIDRIHDLEEFGNMKKVSFQQYVAFQFFLSDLHELKTHVKAFRYINKKVFNELVDKFHVRLAKTHGSKYKISKEQINALFAVLDLDGNGNLDYEEIIGVLETRNMLASGKGDDMKDMVKSAGANIKDLVNQLVGAVRGKLGM